MQSVTVHRYWQFGTCVRYLQDADARFSVHGESCVLENIESLFHLFDELELSVTRRASKDLELLWEELKATARDAKLTNEQAKKLGDIISALRQTLEAELEGVEAYVISPKRLDVRKLVSDVTLLMAPGVFDSLSDTGRLDLTEAAKCIAFERPTAAAFHLMRATEEALRVYYCHFVKRNRLSPMMWGSMVKALQTHRNAKANDVLHRNLDNIRVSFRNPTQHPDKIYDIQEVQDLWGLSIDVINRMNRAIEAYRA